MTVRLALAVALAAGAVLAAGSAAAPRGAADVAAADRLACYPAQFSAFRPRSLRLVDALGRLALTVDSPDRICAPAGAGGARASAGFLTCYRVRPRTAFRPRDVRVADQLGRSTLAVSRPVALCLVSARIDEDASATSPRSAPLVCYAVAVRGTAPRPKLEVEDGFGASEDAVGAPGRLCLPAATTGSPPRAPQLSCYALSSETKGFTVVVRNEWGFLKASPGPRDQLCVAATVASR